LSINGTGYLKKKIQGSRKTRKEEEKPTKCGILELNIE
jgi:hypothetical protein